MAKDSEVEVKAELQDMILSSGENRDVDKQDGVDIKPKENVHVSFVQKMEKRIKEYFGLIKVLIFVVTGILIAIFAFYNVFSRSDNKVPEELMNNLMNVMKMQGGGHLSPITEDPSNSTDF